ncbi:hypothetical protein TNIN_363711 [Trichonephila inaurata madagascariensis]|uniref:Uncharacterized protein n=1 Tax=Trichonephila inaurata madagascariensis TaxID=2747483 RepID=A0A8X7C9C8_9ARAC|nr:hypothetical protein TNIN_363711 [Trichonephila inaurata madagascariensis]
MKENQFLTTENKCIPANKAVEPQKRLFSTRERTAEDRIAKPREEESHKIALSLNTLSRAYLKDEVNDPDISCIVHTVKVLPIRERKIAIKSDNCRKG